MSVGESRLGSYRKIFRRGEAVVLCWPHIEEVLEFGAFLVAYYFAYRYGMSFSRASASPFWFPDSILLCALLMSRPERWWVLVLATLPIRLFSEVARDIPLWFLLTTFVLDSAKGLAGAFALRRFLRNPVRFETVREFAIFGLIAVLLVPAVSAFGGAAGRALLGEDYWNAWMRWFMGDALTQLVVTPAILYWVFGRQWKAKAIDPKRLLEAAVLAVGLIITGYLASHTSGGSADFAASRFYAPVPLLFWAAIRFGVLGASGAVAIIAFLAVEAALQGHGPFSGRPPDETALLLQNFLLLRSAPLLLAAASIDQEKTVERSLVESERRFRNMANCAPVLLWMAGCDKLCNFVNEGWLSFTGRSLEQEIGNGWAQSVHPDDVQHCLQTYHAAFEARQPFRMEYRALRHDGEYRWILDTGAPRFAPNGEFMGYIGSAVDITDHKQAEERSRQLAHLQRLAAMGELTAAIAHEVRQPLAAIMINVEAARKLLDSAIPPLDELREIISDIRTDDEHASEVISRIRDFTLNREVRMQAFDLNSIVADTLHLVAGDALRRRVQVLTELAPRLPLVLGDRTQLQQVLINLAINGMDAMANVPESARYLTVQTRFNGGDHVEVAVMDRGGGIAPDDLPHLFEAFFTTKAEGMGLGLFLAKSIVESHGGRVWAENNPRGGATFRFTLPVAQTNSLG